MQFSIPPVNAPLAADYTAARAALLDRLAVLGAGGAGELTPSRAALLSNLDAAVSTRRARQSVATYFGNYKNLAGGVGTVLLDSGPLAAGDYEIIARAADSSDGGFRLGLIELQYRDAADAVTTWAQILSGWVQHVNPGTNAPSGFLWVPRVAVALNERFRVVSAVAQNGATSGSLWVATV